MTTMTEIKGLAFYDNKIGYFIRTADEQEVLVQKGDEVSFSKTDKNPKKNEFNTELPDHVELNFSGTVIEKGSELRVKDSVFNSMLSDVPLSSFFIETAEKKKRPYQVVLKRSQALVNA